MRIALVIVLCLVACTAAREKSAHERTGPPYATIEILGPG